MSGSSPAAPAPSVPPAAAVAPPSLLAPPAAAMNLNPLGLLAGFGAGAGAAAACSAAPDPFASASALAALGYTSPQAAAMAALCPPSTFTRVSPVFRPLSGLGKTSLLLINVMLCLFVCLSIVDFSRFDAASASFSFVDDSGFSPARGSSRSLPCSLVHFERSSLLQEAVLCSGCRKAAHPHGCTQWPIICHSLPSRRC